MPYDNNPPPRRRPYGGDRSRDGPDSYRRGMDNPNDRRGPSQSRDSNNIEPSYGDPREIDETFDRYMVSLEKKDPPPILSCDESGWGNTLPSANDSMMVWDNQGKATTLPGYEDLPNPSRGGFGGGRGGGGGGGVFGGNRGRDRPPRDFGGERDRPPRDFGGERDRPPRDFGGGRDRPPRDFGGERDRPPRDFGGGRDRPFRDDQRQRGDFGRDRDMEGGSRGPRESRDREYRERDNRGPPMYGGPKERSSPYPQEDYGGGRGGRDRGYQPPFDQREPSSRYDRGPPPRENQRMFEAPRGPQYR